MVRHDRPCMWLPGQQDQTLLLGQVQTLVIPILIFFSQSNHLIVLHVFVMETAYVVHLKYFAYSNKSKFILCFWGARILLTMPFACVTYLCFWAVPDYSQQGKLWWYLVFYCLFQGFLSVSHLSLCQYLNLSALQ